MASATDTKFRAWVHAFRLRTLPLALSSIITGGAVAHLNAAFDLTVTLLAVATTLFLQILSNLANDYGDFIHGTDNEKRVGPVRTVQSGLIKPGEMMRMIILFIVLSLGSGIWLIHEGTKGTGQGTGWIFLIIGILAIIAATAYTIGKKPYGYAGYGDLFVFIFFGWAGVAGTAYLNMGYFKSDILLPASALGFLSTGVLNVNNMRDRENDRASGKYTLVVRAGIRVARLYHAFLVFGAVALAIMYTSLYYRSPFQLLYLLALPFLVIHITAVFRNTVPSELDPQLKKLALTTLFFSLLFAAGLIF